MLVKLLLGNLLKHLQVEVQKEKQNCFALLQLAGGEEWLPVTWKIVSKTWISRGLINILHCFASLSGLPEGVKVCSVQDQGSQRRF